MMFACKINMFQSALEAASPIMTGSLTKIRNIKLENWEKSFSETLGRIFTGQLEMEQAAKAYTRFAMEAAMHQHKFNNSGKYECTSYEDVAKNVYFNDDFMEKLYLPAVLLSHYLWPHLYMQQLFFQKIFLPMVQSVPKPCFCEIGLGSGLYSRLTLSYCLQAKGRGYDVSEAAVIFSDHHISSFILNDRWKGEVRNIETSPPEEKFTHGICVEVLEHLEKPEKLLHSLRNLLQPRARAFIVAAVTAAEYDHIYLYSSPDEVETQLNACGFIVTESRVFTALGYSHYRDAPKLAAFIVERI